MVGAPQHEQHTVVRYSLTAISCTGRLTHPVHNVPSHMLSCMLLPLSLAWNGQGLPPTCHQPGLGGTNLPPSLQAWAGVGLTHRFLSPSSEDQPLSSQLGLQQRQRMGVRYGCVVARMHTDASRPLAAKELLLSANS